MSKYGISETYVCGAAGAGRAYKQYHVYQIVDPEQFDRADNRKIISDHDTMAEAQRFLERMSERDRLAFRKEVTGK